MYKKTILFLLFVFLFSGCIHSIDKKGLTITVPAAQITASLEEEFPISQSFNYGKITLKEPQAILKTGSNRIEAGTKISFSNAFIPAQTGSLYLSGKPVFDAQNSAIYLREPAIENLEFNGYQLNNMLQSALNDALLPLISEIFRNRPIYRLNRNALQNSFINDIQVLNGELLITFGL